jgi:hypothetical protein
MNDRDRQERDEYIVDRLLSDADEADWRATRNLDLGIERREVTHDEMVAAFAADRAAVEGEWAARFDQETVEYGRRRWVAGLAVERQEAREAQEDAA